MSPENGLDVVESIKISCASCTRTPESPVLVPVIVLTALSQYFQLHYKTSVVVNIFISSLLPIEMSPQFSVRK